MTGDSEHIELLRRGPRPWNEWRAENPSIIPNLVGGVPLSIGDRQMGPINGGPINLAHARLRHAVLRFATLTSSNLEGADLADTDPDWHHIVTIARMLETFLIADAIESGRQVGI